MAVIIIDDQTNPGIATITIPGKLAHLFAGTTATLDRSRGAWLLPLTELPAFTNWARDRGHLVITPATATTPPSRPEPRPIADLLAELYPDYQPAPSDAGRARAIAAHRAALAAGQAARTAWAEEHPRDHPWSPAANRAVQDAGRAAVDALLDQPQEGPTP